MYLKVSLIVSGSYVQVFVVELSPKFHYNNDTWIRKWVKKIQYTTEIRLVDFPLSTEFVPVSNIILDTSNRGTLIQFVPLIPKNIWEGTTEWNYIITFNDHIVKIGGTRTGLKGRTGSYLCGHHIRERGKSGDCSKTNGFLYNSILYYLMTGVDVKMYGNSLPKKTLHTFVYGEKKNIDVQTFHIYEGVLLERYKFEKGRYPILNDNSSPETR